MKRRKKKTKKLTPEQRRLERRAKALALVTKRNRELERAHNDALIVLLTHFIEHHYGNPATGRHGMVITGPVGARLTAASSLRALLVENEEVQR